MKRRFTGLFVLVVGLCLVVLAHMYAFTVVGIPGQGFEPALMQGDRALVNRWSYGLRAPFSDHRGYERWYERPARRDEWVAFNLPAQAPTTRPDTMQLCVGMILALPADTVWMGRGAQVAATRSYKGGQIWPVVVPSKGAYIKVHAWDAPLYAQTLRQHEGVDATVQGDSLCIDGKRVSYCRFSQDYYWMSSANDSNFADSRTLGFVPEPCLMGRIEMVLYSIYKWQPRWDRTLMNLY